MTKLIELIHVGVSSFYNFYLFNVLAVLGLCCCVGFSLAAARGGYSSLQCEASHYGGFFCCEAWALGCVGFGNSDMWALVLCFPGSGAQAEQM